MKQSIIGIIIQFVCLAAFGQAKIDCDEFRTERINVSRYQKGDVDSLAALELNNINICLNLDSLDRKLWNSDIITSLIIDLSKDGSDINYGTILDYIEGTMHTSQYRKDRSYLGFISKYDKRPFNESDSIEMHDDLKEMGYSNLEIKKYFDIVFSGKESNITFTEDFINFLQYIELNPAESNQLHESPDLLFGHFQDIETLDELKGQLESDKPLLIYFSAMIDVNSRKMEQFLFKESEISKLLGEFNCFIGYVDDDTKISDKQKETFRDKDLQTKGEYITEIEKLLLPQVQYPEMLILNNEFKAVDSFKYDNSKYEFIKYLKRNKDVR